MVVKPQPFQLKLLHKGLILVLVPLLIETPQERTAFQHMKPAVMDLLLMLEAALRKVDKQERLPQVSERDLARQLTEQANKFNQACIELGDIEKNSETEGALREAATRQAVMNWIGLGIAANVLIGIAIAIYFYRRSAGASSREFAF